MGEYTLRPMKSLIRFFVLLIMMYACNPNDVFSQHHDTSLIQTPDTLKKSIQREEHVKIGKAHIRINYHSPRVRGRIIWGGLVPYEEVWVTGAHSATSFEITRDFSINNKEIPAGKYAIFTIPGKEKWTIIINKNWDQHLTDEYTEQDDLIRIDLIPEYLPTIQERLKYTIVPKNDNTVTLLISWERLKVTLPFDIK